MRVLITNFTLVGRGGTQLYVRDLAARLLDRGHAPVVYSPVLGELARELRERTIPVTDDLETISSPPDVVHGNHDHELIAALLRFPGVPGVRVCHGWMDERPTPFPRVLRYLAVDETTRDRCLSEWGIPERRLRVVLNFVDLARFRPRGPLPSQPRRALVFSNNARRHKWAVEQACRRAGIELDAVGEDLGRGTDRPEELLGAYDLVFAKARAALEAMAVGCAVVLCDAVGVGPMVTSAELDRLRPLNFGLRTLTSPVSPEALAAEIGRYDPLDAAIVSRRIREVSDRDSAVEQILQVYDEALEEQGEAGPVDLADELRVVSSYLSGLSPRLRDSSPSVRAGLHAFLKAIYVRARGVPVIRKLLGGRGSRHARALAARLRGR